MDDDDDCRSRNREPLADVVGYRTSRQIRCNQRDAEIFSEDERVYALLSALKRRHVCERSRMKVFPDQLLPSNQIFRQIPVSASSRCSRRPANEIDVDGICGRPSSH